MNKRDATAALIRAALKRQPELLWERVELFRSIATLTDDPGQRAAAEKIVDMLESADRMQMDFSAKLLGGGNARD